MTDTVLKLDRLCVEIERTGSPARILRGIDLALDQGERLGIVGESGCGKSIMALAIMGLLPDNARPSGQILFDGEDLLEASEPRMCTIRGNRIAMIFQEPMTALNPLQTIGHQVAEGLRLHHKLGWAKAQAQAGLVLDRVGMPSSRFPLSLYPHQLSGGQRQRIIIAMALACDPDMLIADEPTTALDATIQVQILDLIAELAVERRMSLIMISHDLGVIKRTTERMAVMYAGRLVEEGSTDMIFATLAHPYTRGLFAARPQRRPPTSIPARGRDRLPVIPGSVPDLDRTPEGCPFAPRCSRSSAVCTARMPPLASIGRPDHRVACFHPHERCQDAEQPELVS